MFFGHFDLIVSVLGSRSGSSGPILNPEWVIVMFLGQDTLTVLLSTQQFDWVLAVGGAT